MAALPSDPLTRRLVGIYERAERELDRLIAASLRRKAVGSARYYENQRLAVQAVLRRARNQARALVGPSIAASYRSGVGAVDRTLDRSKAFSGVHTASEEVLAANLVGRLRYAEEFVGRVAPDVFRRLSLEEVSMHVAAGLSPRDQALSFEEKLRAEGVTAFYDRTGRRWKLATYARMVTRTTTREAASVGIKNRLLEHGFDLVRISEHHGSCPICLPFQGKTYSLTGRDDRFPQIGRLPPFHPNCRHVLLPAPVAFEDMEKALGLGPPKFPKEEPETGPEPDRVARKRPKPTKKDSVQDHVAFQPNILSTEEHREMVEHELSSIDKVHAYPASMPGIGITVQNFRDATAGQYEFSFDLVSRKFLPDEKIEVGRSAMSAGINSTAHETAHFLDAHYFGEWEEAPEDVLDGYKRYTSDEGIEYASARDPRFEEWRAAVRKTKAYRRLSEAMHQPNYSKSMRDAALYEGSWREFFARTYEQWIATRSGDEAMREKQRGLVAGGMETRPGYVSKPNPYAYFSDEEFVPIGEALDELFRKLGLLRG